MPRHVLPGGTYAIDEIRPREPRDSPSLDLLLLYGGTPIGEDRMLAFVRHGEPRTGEVDPALTSWGHRAASEAGAWLARAGLLPTIIWHTPARRARETAEALAMHLPATTRAIARLPEDDASWAVLLRQLGEHPGDAAIVGHHPTQDYLEVRFGPAPTPIPRNNRAAVLVLEGEPWRIVASWPGRPS